MSAARQALKEFAVVVRRCREQAGYESARSFYRALGGRGFFGVSYRAYASLEQGSASPRSELVERLAAAFRFAHHPQVGREFSLAYLRILLGSAELFDMAREGFRASAEDGGRKAAGSAPADEPGGLGPQEARGMGARRARAGPVIEHPLLVRASRAELESYYPHIEKTGARAADEAGEAGGEKFSIETRLVKLLDF